MFFDPGLKNNLIHRRHEMYIDEEFVKVSGAEKEAEMQLRGVEWEDEKPAGVGVSFSPTEQVKECMYEVNFGGILQQEVMEELV